MNAADRRALGAYYTPSSVARILVAWCQGKGARTFLDPAYGGCAFVDEANRIVAVQGGPDAWVAGIDINPSCAQRVQRDTSLRSDLFRVGDFLDPESVHALPSAPDAIVGNPPYVRIEHAERAVRDRAAVIADQVGYQGPRPRSLWPAFLFRSTQVLAEGGCLAQVVPDALLQTLYGRAVMAHLATLFQEVTAVLLEERLFPGTNERAVVVLAHGAGPGTTVTQSVRTVSQLETLVMRNTAAVAPKNNAAVAMHSIAPAAGEVLESALGSERVAPLGELAALRIGVVTGDNQVFLQSEASANELGIPSRSLLPIVSRSAWLRGTSFTKDDFDLLPATSRKYLFAGSQEETPPAEWLALAEEMSTSARHKCASRKPWWKVPVQVPPDMFLANMGIHGPRLSANPSGIQCTNTILGVWLRRPHSAPSLAAGALTSMTALQAELLGRWYGGGALKLEPYMAKRLSVIAAGVDEATVRVLSRKVAEEGWDNARMTADSILLHDVLGMSEQEIVLLQNEVIRLRLARTDRS